MKGTEHHVPPTLILTRSISKILFLQNKYYFYYYNIINVALSRTLEQNIYTEKHHIIPKSLGGDNTPDNIVVLTGREHFICHRLLTKITSGCDKAKMIFAVHMMLSCKKSQKRHITTSYTYHIIREQVANEMSILHKNKIVSPETRKKLSDAAMGRPSAFKGKTHSAESLLLISEAVKAKSHSIHSPENAAKRVATRAGYRHSDETKRKISKSNMGKTVIHTIESNKKRSETLKGRVSPMKGKEPWNKGIPHNDDTRKIITERARNRQKYSCPHCLLDVAGGNFTRWHGDNCKHKK
jgi:hypothetical protein